MRLRIYVDFNTMMMDEEERVHINAGGFKPNKPNLSTHLRPGLLVTLYDEELEVEATLETVEDTGGQVVWLGRPDWATRRDLSQPALSATE